MTTQSIKRSRIYKDIDLSFGVNAFSKDLNSKLDVNAVKQSMKSLMLTQRGERPFHPEIGSSIYHLLFEPMTPGQEMSLKAIIEDVLRTFEPRCLLEEVSVRPNFDLDQYEIKIFFHVVGVNEPQELAVALKRLR
tara:strand:- start:8002 stop:8406 length:405 start_codon:yes stop_codon:yes gene_type:complete